MDSTKTITTKDGRLLAFLEVGTPGGPLVIHNHGGPSSRLEAGLFADAATKHGLRFICVDRPGIGRSSPQKNRSFAGWANDLVALADALGAREFGVTGWSEGGPWALAAAAYIDPARLRHVTNIAGGSYGAFGDNWAADHLSKVDALGGNLALHFKPGFRALYWMLGVTATRFRKSYLQQLDQAANDYDQRILHSAGVESAFSEMSAECFAQGSTGLVRDSEMLYRRWAFDVTAIQRPVHFWQGTEDRFVPRFINRQIADRMPGAVWHEVEGAGHFVALGCMDAILKIAAEELAAGH